jgi:hypothetical protein
MDRYDIGIGLCVIFIIGLIGIVTYVAIEDAQAFNAMKVPTPINQALHQEVGSRLFVSGTVTKFDHEDSLTTFVMVGKVMVPIVHHYYYYDVVDSTGTIMIKFNSGKTIGEHVDFKGHNRGPYLE